MRSLEAGMNLASSKRRRRPECEAERGRGRQQPGSPRKPGQIRNLGLFQRYPWESRNTGTLLLTPARMALRVGKAIGD